MEERNLGPQPIGEILKELNLSAHDLVEASSVQMTHKMVSRAVKGRWLTKNTKEIVLNALNTAAQKEYAISDLFNY